MRALRVDPTVLRRDVIRINTNVELQPRFPTCSFLRRCAVLSTVSAV